jgi:hypothetical protein
VSAEGTRSSIPFAIPSRSRKECGARSRGCGHAIRVFRFPHARTEPHTFGVAVGWSSMERGGAARAKARARERGSTGDLGGTRATTAGNKGQKRRPRADPTPPPSPSPSPSRSPLRPRDPYPIRIRRRTHALREPRENQSPAARAGGRIYDGSGDGSAHR